MVTRRVDDKRPRDPRRVQQGTEGWKKAVDNASRKAAVERLISLHEKEFALLLGEERARLTDPTSPARMNGLPVELPTEEIIKRYVNREMAASILEEVPED